MHYENNCNKHQQPFSRLLAFLPLFFALHEYNYLHLHLASNKQNELK